MVHDNDGFSDHETLLVCASRLRKHSAAINSRIRHHYEQPEPIEPAFLCSSMLELVTLNREALSTVRGVVESLESRSKAACEMVDDVIRRMEIQS